LFAGVRNSGQYVVVRIDETRRDDQPFGVDRASGDDIGRVTYEHYAITANPHIGDAWRCAGSVVYGAAADQNVDVGWLLEKKCGEKREGAEHENRGQGIVGQRIGDRRIGR
jgi:hypothetical protein